MPLKSQPVHIRTLFDKVLRGFDEAKLVGDDRIVLSLDKNEAWTIALSLSELDHGHPEPTIHGETAIHAAKLTDMDWTLHIES